MKAAAQLPARVRLAAQLPTRSAEGGSSAANEGAALSLAPLVVQTSAIPFSLPPLSPGDDPRDLAARMRSDLAEIELARMPFGKFGPNFCPPNGLPIFDLPVEYLGWFLKKGGWPKGRLGELLQIVHQMKADGSDFAFDAMRQRRGGKASLRPEPPPKSIHFGD